MAQTISLAYETALNSLSRSSKGYIFNVNTNETITADDYLKQFKIHSLFQKETSLFGNTVAKYVEIELISDDRNYDNWLNTQVIVYLGLEISPGVYEYIKQGLFRVRESNVDNDNYVTKLLCYDGMVRLNQPYSNSELSSYPKTLSAIAEEAVEDVGLTLQSNVFPNSTFMTEAPNVSTNEYTYRNIIEWIAELSGTNAVITVEGQLKFVPWAPTASVVINSDQYYTLSLDPQFGALTAVQMSRSALGDEISFPATLAESDIVYNISDNMVAYNQRETIIESIYTLVNGLSYRPYSLKWDGVYFLELGDALQIVDTNDNIINTYYCNSILTYNGGVTEELFMRAYTPEVAAVKIQGALTKKNLFTDARVDKIENEITFVIADVETLNGDFTQLQLDLNTVTTTVQNTNSSLTTLQSQVTQNATDVNIAFSQNSEMKQYYNYNENELSIGRPGNPGIIRIGFPSNVPEVILSDGANNTATIKSDQMTIKNIIVGESLSTGKHTVKTLEIGGTVYTVFLPQG
jgi:hypothetical protein